MNPSLRHNFFKYVSLNMLGMIGISLYILADTYFIAAALGEKGIAALNFSIPVFSMIYGVGLLFGMGGATLYSMTRAKGDEKEANSIFNNAFVAGLVCGVVFLILGVFFAREIGLLLGADASTIALTKLYLRTVMSFSPLFVINQIFMTFVRNDKNPRLPMIAMLIGSLSNIVLDYIFVFPLGLGMFGAALATGASPIVSLLLLSSHIRQNETSLKLISTRLRPKLLHKMSVIGLPVLITELSSSIILITFNRVIWGFEGTIGVASYGIIANIALVVTAMFVGIAQGIQPLLSSFYGHRDWASLGKLRRYAAVTSLGIAFFTYGLLFLYGDLIVAAFNTYQDQAIARIAGNGLRLYFVGYFFAGLNIITTMVLSCSEKNRSAFFLSLSRGCILLVPIVLLMSQIGGMNGVLLSFLATDAIIFIGVQMLRLDILRS